MAVLNHCTRRIALASVLVLIGNSHQSFSQISGSVTPSPRPNKETYLKLAHEMEDTLHRDVLYVWFPRNVYSQNGGFYSGFDRKWQPTDSEGKFSVFQGRMTWISSQIVLQHPELKSKFLPIARHGLDFLNDVLWDKQYGGFFWGVDDH